MKQYIAGLVVETRFKAAKATLEENGAKNVRQHEFMKTLVYFDTAPQRKNLGGVPITEYSNEDIKGISDAHVSGVLAAWLESRTDPMTTLEDVREVGGSFLSNATQETVNTQGKDHNRRFLDASSILYGDDTPIQDVPEDDAPINMPEEEYKGGSGKIFSNKKVLIGAGVAGLLAVAGFFIFLQL